MRRLRDPQTGCPWDVRQDFRSIAPYTLEEAYEVVDAIEQGDREELRDELGDLLLQVVFHARMAEEEGCFAFPDVVRSICDKMLRRHPHVFGDVEHADEDVLHAAWERQKRHERRSKGDARADSLLDGVARALPSLLRAEKLQKRAARGGFDWDRPEPVLEKVAEELRECADALADAQDPRMLEEEVGDLLFSCVNLARHLKVDAEQALRRANGKFERRFRAVEAGLRAEGLEPSVDQRERMESLWQADKKQESGT